MTEQQKNELAVIRSRIQEDLFTPPVTAFKNDPKVSHSISMYEALTAAYADGTYYFTDLNYAPENRTSWGATSAAHRLITLLKLGNTEGGAEKERAHALVLGHLRGFQARQYTNLNWWHLYIGIPQTVARILLMLEGDVESTLYAYLLSLVEQGSITKHPDLAEHHSGANLIWFCDISLLHALLVFDADEASLAVACIAKETEGRPDAGLQEDGSFFQHGRLLYSLGYGRSYVTTLSPLLYYLDGTSFALPPRALENILSHVLDGIRHMTHCRGFDYLAMGREYVRVGATDTKGFKHAMAYLAKMTDIPREQEVKDFYSALCRTASPLTANKYFSVCRYLTHQEEELYVGFKALDESLCGTEVCNYENVLGAHLSYATNTCVMRTGEEYRSISPLLRYDYMPGTTSAEESDEAMEARFATSDPSAMSIPPDVLLTSGGNYGDLAISHYQCRHDGITQSATCIATPHSALLIGGGRHSADRALHTTLEQCNVQGEVTVSEDGRLVNHGGVCYLCHEGMPLSSVEHRTGSLQRNNRLSPNIPHEGDIFTLFIPHEGKEFTYAYEILSEKNLHLASAVLVNDATQQRVRLADGREICIRLSDGEISVD